MHFFLDSAPACRSSLMYLQYNAAAAFSNGGHTVAKHAVKQA